MCNVHTLYTVHPVHAVPVEWVDGQQGVPGAGDDQLRHREVHQDKVERGSQLNKVSFHETISWNMANPFCISKWEARFEKGKNSKFKTHLVLNRFTFNKL